MNISFSSVIIAVLSTNLLIIMLSLILLKPNTILYINPKYVLLCITFIAIRIFFPYEFFYTLTIKSENVMPYIQHCLEFSVPTLNISLFQLLLIVWGMGFLFKLIVLLLKQFKMEKTICRFPNSMHMPILREVIACAGIKTTIALVEIPNLITPAIIGLWNTKIIIPTNIREEDIYFILLHEIEHYKRRDLEFIAALHLLCAVYWWNPIVYLLKSNAQKFIELRVDTAITDKMNAFEKASYLESILNVAKAINQKCDELIWGVGFYERQSDLSKRFSNVLYGKDKRSGFVISLFIFCLSVLSTSIIIEPYAINKEDEVVSYRISENSYFINKGGKYDLYIDEVYFITTDQVEKFEGIKIYNSLEEKNEAEKNYFN